MNYKRRYERLRRFQSTEGQIFCHYNLGESTFTIALVNDTVYPRKRPVNAKDLTVDIDNEAEFHL